MPSPEVPSPMPRLIALVGPTAVGKTDVSLHLAAQLNAEIISADSRLFYIGMDIGTAKPTLDERNRVRHHLIDVTLPDQTWSLAVFQKAAHAAILEINQRGNLPILVGGTGQYIRAVLEGWHAPTVEPDEALRQVLNHLSEQIGSQELHHRLGILDPEAAGQIDYRNVRRTVRALEVIFTTGKRFSAQRERRPLAYQALVLGLTRPRTELYARIDARIESMIANGWIDEVKGLLAVGYEPDLPAFSAIGYREIIAYLLGQISLPEAITLIQRQSRVFVRRQANWFKRDDPAIHWFEANHDVIPAMLTMIECWQADFI